MNCTYEDGYWYLRVPGALLYARNKDLLWPSYMTLMIMYPQLLRDAEIDRETLRVRCED